MKKFLVGILVVALLATTGFAGELGYKGVKLGINMANVTGDDASEDAAMKLGFAFGGFADYTLNDNMAIGVELAFSMKGYKAESTVAGIDITSTLALNYIDIPILFKYYMKPGEDMNPVVFVGPCIGMLMSANATMDIDGDETETDVKDTTTGMDMGLAIGAGVAKAMGEHSLLIDVRYVMGMSSIDDSDAELDYKNTLIQIGLGYTF